MSDNRAVPEAAVDAALSGVFSTSDLSRAVWASTIRDILTAAAPHMMAGAIGRRSELTEISELADLIWSHTDGTDEEVPEIAARRIYDAGWRKVAPRRTFADLMAKRSHDAVQHESRKAKQ